MSTLPSGLLYTRIHARTHIGRYARVRVRTHTHTHTHTHKLGIPMLYIVHAIYHRDDAQNERVYGAVERLASITAATQRSQ